jgi:hypothetical protein
MPQAEYDTLFGEVQRAYRLAGAPDLVETRIHDQEHCIDNIAAYSFLAEQIATSRPALIRES